MTAASRKPTPAGDQELALLRWLAERGGASVGEAAEAYGAARGLARSTVLTMMERLRAKGHLRRRREGGVYRYHSPASAGQVLRGAVERFVDKTLGGSFSPVVAYLAERAQVSRVELAELEALVERLQAQKAEDER